MCSKPPLGYQYTVFESAPTTALAKASALTPQTALPTDCAAVGKPTVKQLLGNTHKPLRYAKGSCTKCSKLCSSFVPGQADSRPRLYVKSFTRGGKWYGCILPLRAEIVLQQKSDVGVDKGSWDGSGLRGS